MSIASRLEELRGNVPIAEFAQLFGIHKNTYSNYVKRQNMPDTKFVLAVCQKFGVSTDWLLLGIGRKYLADQLIGDNSKDFDLKQHVLLPLIETWVIGREGEIVHDGILDYVPIQRKWLDNIIPNLSVDRVRSLLLTRVRGTCMVPTVKPGDLILVDTDRTGRDHCRDRSKGGDIFLVRLPDGERALKRVAFVKVTEGCRVIFFSDNTTDYKIFQFTLTSREELHRFILGRVLWLFRDLWGPIE